jgi:hypothetical protein
MSIARRIAFCALLAVALAAPASGAEWADRFSLWNQANEGRALGANNSASLAWWESYVLQAYLRMYSATGDSLWLNRFCVHADTMLAVARDVPDSGTYWPGYRDGFLGWGTDRYDPGHQYQEYMVHDGMACLPLARFSRMVLSDSLLRKRYGVEAGRYVDFIEANVVDKWCANWNAARGTGEDLSSFGGWQNLPFNQSLVFGELLLVLDRAGEIRGLLRRGLPQEISQTRTSGFYSEVPDSMARVLKSCLLYNVDRDAYIWRYQEPNSYWEDISHANLDLSFALEAHADGVVFSDTDLTRFAGTLEEVMWNRSVAEPQFTRYVNGSGVPDSTGNLEAWLLLGDFRAQAYWLIMAATQVLCNSTPPQSLNAGQALVLATLAEMQPRFPDNIDPHLAVEESAGTVPGGLSPNGDCPQCPMSAAPNPFAERVSISYLLSVRAPVSLRVYDSSGRLVRTLVEQEQEPGPHRTEWRGEDDGGNLLPAGTFLALLSAGPRRLSRRITLLR